MTASLRVHGREEKPCCFGQIADQIHVLDGLAGGTLADIVYDGGDQEAVCPRVAGRRHHAEVRSIGPLGLDRRGGRIDLHKRLIFIKITVELEQLVVCVNTV